MNTLKHVAIIMDGNRRWAKNHALSAHLGHQKGSENIDKVIRFCAYNGVKTLTLYSFSTENWKRDKKEVDFLISLFKKFIDDFKDIFVKNGVKFDTIGDLDSFDDELRFKIYDCKKATENGKFTLILAVNYGSRDEITRACQKVVRAGLEISQENIANALDSAPYGDIDLLIRTGGERRLSNFLLWQSSYAELMFSDTLWPDFDDIELAQLFECYKKIERKFGR